MIRLLFKSLFTIVALFVVGYILVASVMMVPWLAAWPMDKYLLPAIAMVGLSMAVGLATVWAARSGRHWFVRTAVVGASISPALLIPGYDLVLVLAVQVVGIVVLLTCGKCWRHWRAVRSGEDRESPADPIAWRARFRFTLADLLLFTTVLAVVLAVGTQVPRAVWAEWVWIATVGFLAGLPVVFLFGRRKGDRQRTGRFNFWIMRPLVFCTWPLGLCTGVTLVHFVLLPGTPVPTVVLPEPNGYDDLVQAGLLLSSGAMPDVDAATAAELAELPDTQSQALALARRGLNRESLVPLTYTPADVNGNEDGLIRVVTRALDAEGGLAEMEGRHADAVTCYLDILRSAEASARGGLLLHTMVGWALSRQAAQGLASSRESLGVTECLRAIATLEAFDANRESFETIRARDLLWAEHGQGKIGRYSAVVMGPSFSSAAIDPMKAGLRRNQVLLRLLTCHLALRQYRLEHGTEPDDLDSLVPEILTTVPQDPYGTGPLVYRRTDTGFDLYSIGLDGVDDGGKPLEKKPGAYYLGDVHLLEPVLHGSRSTASGDESTP